MPINMSYAPRAYEDNTGYNVAAGIGNTLRAGMGALTDYEKQKALEEAMRQEAMVKQAEAERTQANADRTQANADRMYEIQKSGVDRGIAKDEREAMLSDADRQILADQQAGFSGALTDQSEWMTSNPDAPDEMVRANLQGVAGARKLTPDMAVKLNALQKQQVDPFELAAARAKYAEELASKNNASRERIARWMAARETGKKEDISIPTSEAEAQFYETEAARYEQKANDGAGAYLTPANPNAIPAAKYAIDLRRAAAVYRSRNPGK